MVGFGVANPSSFGSLERPETFAPILANDGVGRLVGGIGTMIGGDMDGAPNGGGEALPMSASGGWRRLAWGSGLLTR